MSPEETEEYLKELCSQIEIEFNENFIPEVDDEEKENKDAI